MKPFSKNIIFLDTELSSLDPYEGEILSIAIVKYTGEHMYLELEHPADIAMSAWVQENLLDTLTKPKVSRTAAVEIITDFIGPEKPYAVAFVDNNDIIYSDKLFGHENLPFYWMSIDIAAILFAMGRDHMPICLTTQRLQLCMPSLV